MEEEEEKRTPSPRNPEGKVACMAHVCTRTYDRVSVCVGELHGWTQTNSVVGLFLRFFSLYTCALLRAHLLKYAIGRMGIELRCYD